MSNLINTKWKFQIIPQPSMPSAPFDIHFLSDGQADSIFKSATYTENGDDFILTIQQTSDTTTTWTGSHANGSGSGSRTMFGADPAPFQMSKLN